MKASERIKLQLEKAFDQQIKEVAQATGKTYDEAKLLLEIEAEIQAEHEMLTGISAPYIK